MNFAANISMGASHPAHDSQGNRDFRRDINSLRAIAVVLVVLFHFGVANAQGGFIGVDVFFVISGYLMTRIIAKGLDSGRFRLLDFYMARARRIVPALLALCLVLVLFGVFYVDPETEKDIGKYALSALLFVSNVVFAFKDSYFSPVSDNNWLLHTWTLSVEWQFYLIYPVILMTLSRIAFVWRWRFSLCLAATAVLFVLTVLFCRSNVTFQLGFFLLPTRAWELLVGGCVAMAPAISGKARAAAVLQWAGLLLILGAGFGLSSLTPWPSAWTAIPVLGAAAILVAGRDLPLGLSTRPVQAVGTWSYSIYLWHWPIVVAMHYRLGELSPLAIAVGAAASCVVGYLSYHLFEIRLRDFMFARRDATASRQASWRTGLVCSLAAAACLSAWTSAGFETYLLRDMNSATREALADYKAAAADWIGHAPCPDKDRRLPIGHVCQLGAGDHFDIAVIGDSHVEQLIARYAQPGAIPDNRSIDFIFKDGCPPIPQLNVGLPGMRCAEFFDETLKFVKANGYRHVVLLAFWPSYFQLADGAFRYDAVCWGRGGGKCDETHDDIEFSTRIRESFSGLAATMRDLREQGISVTLIGAEPITEKERASSLYRQTFLTNAPTELPPIHASRFAAIHDAVLAPLREAAESANVKFIDPLASQCDADRCGFYLDGRFLFKDGNHLRASIVTQSRFRFFDDAIFGSG